jgi:hypothetical protein
MSGSWMVLFDSSKIQLPYKFGEPPQLVQAMTWQMSFDLL